MLIPYEKAIRLAKNKKVNAIRTRDFGYTIDVVGIAELDIIVKASEEEIRGLAYKKWQEAGEPSGRDLEFWTAAEATIKVETSHVMLTTNSYDLWKLLDEN